MTVSATEALNRLRDGNGRFLEAPSIRSRVGGSDQGFTDLSAGQEPFAAVLGCSDSRVPVETLFDQGPGDLFVVRVAGNVVGQTQIGSLEFAVEELGISLVLVLGHSHCGAVSAALLPPPEADSWMASKNLQVIIGRIARVLEQAQVPRGAGGVLSVDKAVRLNVKAAADDLLRHSEVLASRVRSGELRIVESVFDLETGRVEFLL